VKMQDINYSSLIFSSFNPERTRRIARAGDLQRVKSGMRNNVKLSQSRQVLSCIFLIEADVYINITSTFAYSFSYSTLFLTAQCNPIVHYNFRRRLNLSIHLSFFFGRFECAFVAILYVWFINISYKLVGSNEQNQIGPIEFF